MLHHTRSIGLDALPLANLSAGEVVVTGLALEVVLSAGADDALPAVIQLTPRGEVKTRDNRHYIFNPEKLVAAFSLQGLKLPIDFEHESLHTATLGATPARGWIVAVEARAEGLFGTVEWLPDAIAALKAKAYRYISPTMWLEPDGKTARLLKAAALCASPALHGMTAVASSSHPSLSGATPMKSLLSKLGLTENATEEEAIAKLSALTPDPADFVPVAQLTAANAELAALRAENDAVKQATETAKCQALVDKGVTDGKITPAAKDHYMTFAKASFAACSAAIDAMPILLSGGADTAIDAAAKAQDGNPAALSAEEADIAKSLGLTTEAFAAAKAV